jgi:DNA-binding response OmpR family regulator
MKKKIILIVEDEKILSEMYRDKFERSGFSVYSAFDVEEALKSVTKIKPSLILLDILLPRENGIVFLRKAKLNSKISSIPIIAFSNFDDPQTRKEAYSLGAKDYLIKTDYTPKEIVDKINILLD